MKTEVIISIIGFVSALTGTVTAWHFGKKQGVQNQYKQIEVNSLDPISRGADSLISTGERMLDRLEALLIEEQKHKENCEAKLKEQDKKIKELYKLIREK